MDPDVCITIDITIDVVVHAQIVIDITQSSSWLSTSKLGVEINIDAVIRVDIDSDVDVALEIDMELLFHSQHITANTTLHAIGG